MQAHVQNTLMQQAAAGSAFPAANNRTRVLAEEPAPTDAAVAAAVKKSACPMHSLFGGDGGEKQHTLPARIAIFAFGLIAYSMFFGTISYAIGFVAGGVVPKHIDNGPEASAATAMLINGSILALFVIQHTIMARPAFKRVWTRIVPHAVERSIFVASASAILMLLFWQWRPMHGWVWDVSDNPVARYGLIALSMAGWAIVFLSSFMVSHFDLFGLRQVWFKLRGRPTPPIPFRLVGFYKLVRHPLMVGFLIAFWATPAMSVGHMFFAAMTTAYIVFGTWIEERDLVAQFGDTYRAYQQSVAAFVPVPRIK